MITKTLPFGEGSVEAALPDETMIARGTGAGVKLPPADEAALVSKALEQPLGVPRLRDLARTAKSALIAFDDPTVPSFGPIRGVAIKRVLGELEAGGLDESKVELVCANALHRKFTTEELALGLGDDLVRRLGNRLSCHDAEDRANLVDLGTTPEGHPVEVHRSVVDRDLVIYVNAGSILGFSGGWKSVCVGLSTWKSIKVTHTPDGMSMSLEKNRMHAMLDKMGERLERTLRKRVFKLETVLANPLQTAAVFAGGVTETRAAMVDLLKTVTLPRRAGGEPADIVLYGVPAWSPYAVHARMNPILTLISSALGYLGGHIEARGKPGCTVILATPCPDEWDDEHHPAYREAWRRVLPVSRDPYVISERFLEEFATREDYIERYRHGVAFHPVHAILATHPLKRLRHAGRVIVAGASDPRVPEHLGFLTAPTVEDAIDLARSFHGRGASLCLVDQSAF